MIHPVSIQKAIRKIVFTMALLSAVLATAQEPLLTPQQMPNPVRFLPPPPASGSDAFTYDQSQYHWGKEQRQDSARCAMAVSDADWRIENICRVFSNPFGMEISAKRTPAIYEMLYVGLITADQVSRIPKKHYQRIRPYAYFEEPTPVPKDEEELRNNGSYPSGHTLEGWTAALLLTELNPERADTLLRRGYMYGQSRVIVGYHWQSDVQAGMHSASAAVARLHADRRFERLMKKARREYRRIVRH